MLWSGARAAGVPLSAWPGWDRAREPDVAAEVRRAAYEIIKRKGAGAFGLRDVALSLPAVVGASGAVQVLEPEIADHEREALARSADVLRRGIASLR